MFYRQPIPDDDPRPSQASWHRLLREAAADFASAQCSGEIEPAQRSLRRVEMRLNEAFVRGLAPKG
jgi:hypothetical protein